MDDNPAYSRPPKTFEIVYNIFSVTSVSTLDRSLIEGKHYSINL